MDKSLAERLREYAPLFVEEAAANIRAAADRLEVLERQLAAPLSAELPPLPEHALQMTQWAFGAEPYTYYTAEQMQEYARAAQRAAPQQGSGKDTLTPGDFWLKHDDELRYVKRVLEAGREATDTDRRKALDTIHALRTIVRAAPQSAPQQKPVAWYEQAASGEWFLAYSFNPNAVTKPLYFGAGVQP